MTTTAHEDQFTTAPEPVTVTFKVDPRPAFIKPAPVRQPYITEAILRRNIADMEVALRKQTERAEKAEAELAKARDQKPVGYIPVTDFATYSQAAMLPVPWQTLPSIPLYSAPVPAPAVPYGVDEEAANRIALAVYDCKNGINPEPLLYVINRILAAEAHPLSVEGKRALLQSAEVTK